MCCVLCVCSCNEGYGGAYCQLAVNTTSDLPLLVSLSTLLPVAAALVVIVAVVFIYTRLKATPTVSADGTQRRNNLRAEYDTFTCSDDNVLTFAVRRFSVQWALTQNYSLLLSMGHCGHKNVEVRIALYGLKKTHHRATERHLPYGITQCYLPPDRHR